MHIKTNFDEFINSTISERSKESSFNIKLYINRGITQYLSLYGPLSHKLKKLVKYEEIPVDIATKIYEYQKFEQINKNSLKQKTTLFFANGKYKIFDALGMVALLGREEVRARYDDIYTRSNFKSDKSLYDLAMEELRSIPELTGEVDEDTEKYIQFTKTLSAKESPYRNFILVLYNRFLNEIEELTRNNEN